MLTIVISGQSQKSIQELPDAPKKGIGNHLVINRGFREKYVDALEKADQGDLSNLINLFDQY